MIATGPGLIIYRLTMSRDSLLSFGEWIDLLELGSWAFPSFEYQRIRVGYPKALFPPDGKTINTYLPWNSSKKPSRIALKWIKWHPVTWLRFAVTGGLLSPVLLAYGPP